MEKYIINPITGDKILSTEFIVNDYFKIKEENKQLKEKLQQKQDIINKAKEFAKGHIFQFDGDKDFDTLIEIRDNKGE